MESTSPPEPEDLLRNARAGNAEALGRLFEAYRDYLRFLARVQIGRRLQGKADPSDLVQEAFLGAARDFAQFRGTTEAEFLGWLRGILASLLANLVRHYQGTRRRDVRLEKRLHADLERSSQWRGPAVAAQQSSPSEQAARREDSARVLAALERLTESDRNLLTLRHLEGLSFPEVARRLGRTLDGVKKQWPRALARLRQALGEDE